MFSHYQDGIDGILEICLCSSWACSYKAERCDFYLKGEKDHPGAFLTSDNKLS